MRTLRYMAMGAALALTAAFAPIANAGTIHPGHGPPKVGDILGVETFPLAAVAPAINLNIIILASKDTKLSPPAALLGDPGIELGHAASLLVAFGGPKLGPSHVDDGANHQEFCLTANFA